MASKTTEVYNNNRVKMLLQRHYKPKDVKGDFVVLHVPIIIIYMYTLINNIHFYTDVRK